MEQCPSSRWPHSCPARFSPSKCFLVSGSARGDGTASLGLAMLPCVGRLAASASVAFCAPVDATQFVLRFYDDTSLEEATHAVRTAAQSTGGPAAAAGAGAGAGAGAATKQATHPPNDGAATTTRQLGWVWMMDKSIGTFKLENLLVARRFHA